MKVLSFNCKGLVCPHKRSALRQVVELYQPEIILLQETLGEGLEVKTNLESQFGGWCFETLDVRGHSSYLAIGWNSRSVKVLNVWGMESILGISIKALDMVDTFDVINIYGPYLNRISFWDTIIKYSMFGGENLIIGGDLNFSLGQAEVQGPHARPDLLSDYFTRLLVDKGWLDVEPILLKPTWKNNRCGEGRVAKTLDRFLISERIVNNCHLVRQWIGSGGLSDHSPIFLELRDGPNKPPCP